MRHRDKPEDVRVEVADVESQATIDALAELRAAWAIESGRARDEGYESRFLAWFAREKSRREFFVARDAAGAPVGMVNLVLFERMPTPGREGGGWGYLSNMFVAEPHRDAGVGATMMSELLRRAEVLGLERIVLNPTERAIPFYERHGFRGNNELMVR